MDNDRDLIIKNAQYRKNLSIGYFNSTNSAIEMVRIESQGFHPGIGGVGSIDFKGRIEHWRTYFLNAHRDYYAQVITQVGTNFNVEDTIEKINAVQSLDDLTTLWISLSQDERSNDEIFKVAQTKKLTYEKAQ